MAASSSSNAGVMPATLMHQQEQDEAPLLDLQQVVQGVVGAIKVMICRHWKIINPSGQSASTEFVASDEKGNVIQLSAPANCARQPELSLTEGQVHSILGFKVVPINPLYVNWNINGHALHLGSNTTVLPIECLINGFNRHPFTLIDLEAIRDNKATYIVDVVGLVTNVGELSTTPVGHTVLQFDIVNERGISLRTTLFGDLGSSLLNKRETEDGAYIIILTSMQPKEFRGEMYLSSTCATIMYNEPDIPPISQFKSSVSYGTPPRRPYSSTVLPYKDVSLTQMLYLGRAHKAGGNKETATLNCMVTIKKIRDNQPWFYYWCGVCNSTKGVDEVGGIIWCDCCEDVCAIPLARLRLHFDVTDGDTTVAVVVPDEAADSLIGISAATLVNQARGRNVDELPLEIQFMVDTRHVFELKSHTYIDHGHYESFICSAIIKPHAHDQFGVVSLTRNESRTPYAMTTTGTLNSPYNPTKKLRLDGNGDAGTSMVTPVRRARVRRGLDYFSSDEE